MNVDLLAIITGEDGNYYFDNNAESLVYALIGFLVVFAGILILIGLLYLVGYIIRKAERSGVLFKKKSKAVEESVSAESDEVADEVRAAIVAAVMAYYSAEKPQCEFVVKRIKRIKE